MTHYTVTYEVESKDIPLAAHNIAIGQSIGNPNIRSEIEMSPNIKEMEALVRSIDGNTVKIDFPLKAFDWPNISQLLCIIQGGQSDIELVEKCRVVDIQGLPYMNKPVLGMKAMKKRVGAENRPLFGSIVKPKSGLNEEQLIFLVEQMIDGGTDFIKEDEIMANNSYLPLPQRVEIITDLIDKKNSNVVYSYCINADPMELMHNLEDVYDGGGDCVHINFWSGLGAYTSSNAMGLITHYQRSGIRILTDPGNRFSVSWPVVVKLGIMAGIDTMHIGMLGGYYPEGESEEETLQAFSLCEQHDRVAALSCGMNPDVAKEIRGNIGNNWMANIGGWLHSGDSIYQKVYEMRKSLD
jgi:ribulose-bisphosphate carboxylase large chain